MSQCIQFADQTLVAASVSGEERLSAPFRYVVELRSPRGLDDYLGGAVTLEAGGRELRGIVSCVEQLDEDRHELEVVPALWRLSLEKHTETYHHLSVPEIVAAVVAASGLALEVRSRLRGHYATHASVCQRDESNLAFLSRLLQQEHIRYAIEHDGEREALVLCDHPAQFGRGESPPIFDLRHRSRLGEPVVFSGKTTGAVRAGQLLTLASRECLVTRVFCQQGETSFEAIDVEAASDSVARETPASRPKVVIETGPGQPVWQDTTQDTLSPLHYADRTSTQNDGKTETLDVTSTPGQNDTWFRIAVPHTKVATDTKGKWTYLRIGEAAHDAAVTANDGRTAWTEKGSTDDLEHEFDNTEMAGVFDYTDHYRTVYTRIDKEEYVRGDYRMTVAGGDDSPVWDEHITSSFILDANYVNQLELNQGANFSIDSGIKSETFVGLHNENHLLGRLDLTAANELALWGGWRQELIRGDTITYRKGEELRMSQSEDVRAQEKIEMCIGTANKSALVDRAEILMGVLAVAGTAGLTATSAYNSDEATIATTAAIGTVYAGLTALFRWIDTGRELEDGDPFIGLNNSGGDKDMLLYCDEFRIFTSKNNNRMVMDDSVTTGPPPLNKVLARHVGMKAASAGIEIKTAAAAAGKSLTLQCGKAKIILKNDSITLEGVDVNIKESLEVTKEAKKGGQNFAVVV